MSCAIYRRLKCTGGESISECDKTETDVETTRFTKVAGYETWCVREMGRGR